MECKQARPLLDTYFDGELSSEDKENIKRHLLGCSECTSIHEQMASLRKDILAEGRRNAPAGLRKRVKSALENDAYVPVRSDARPSWFANAAPAMAAGLILGLVASPILSDMMFGRTDLSRDIVAAHVRSQMDSHLTDVASSDMHTVKPWFSGKLDFSPPVYDLTDAGFTLIGGRVDYLDEQPVAALLYQRQRHVINLFIWPDSEARFIPMKTRQGYNVLNWRDADLTFWAISDLNKVELDEMRQLLLDRAP